MVECNGLENRHPVKTGSGVRISLSPPLFALTSFFYCLAGLNKITTYASIKKGPDKHCQALLDFLTLQIILEHNLE